jgi:predicted HicB family RNase H-like nuclease
MCKEDGVVPQKVYSGKFNVRVPSNLHAEIAEVAIAEGKSLNQWISDTMDQAVHR